MCVCMCVRQCVGICVRLGVGERGSVFVTVLLWVCVNLETIFNWCVRARVCVCH